MVIEIVDEPDRITAFTAELDGMIAVGLLMEKGKGDYVPPQ